MMGNLSKRAGTAGEVGLATGSGVLAASAGAAVEGGLAGAASYTTLAALGETGGWDWGDFAGSTLGGLGSGALMGSVTGAVSYGVSDGYRDMTLQKIEDYGFEHGRNMDVMNFYNAIGERQRAIDFYAYRVRGYTSVDFEYSDVVAGLRGRSVELESNPILVDPNEKITIYSDAFKAPNDEWGFDDVTGMMQTVDHEARHRFMNGSYYEAMKYDVYNGKPLDVNNPMIVRSYIETRVYNYNASVAREYGYSPAVTRYVEKMASQAGVRYAY